MSFSAVGKMKDHYEIEMLELRYTFCFQSFSSLKTKNHTKKAFDYKLFFF
jgi:hypothetical protein